MSENSSVDFSDMMKSNRLNRNNETTVPSQEKNDQDGDLRVELKTGENLSSQIVNVEIEETAVGPELSNENKTELPVIGRATDDLLKGRVESTPPKEYVPPVPFTEDTTSYSDEQWKEYYQTKGGVWKILKYPIVLPTLLCLTGLLGFYLYAQTISLVESLLSMPMGIRIPLFGLLIVLTALVICGLYDYWRTYMRLQANFQVVWSELKDMQTIRKERDSRTAIKAAVDYLKKYIARYPLPGQKEKSDFFKEDEIKAMRSIRARLTDKNCPDSSEGWKNRFEQEFQTHLNAAAGRRIESVARISSVKTAISPYPTMDMMIVFFWSFTMVRDLCRIYHLRTGFIGTSYLLCCVFANTFFTGKLDEMESEIGKTVTDQLSEHTNVFDFLPNAIEGTAKTLAGAFAGKASTALANYLLMRRLGYRAVQMLKPLR